MVNIITIIDGTIADIKAEKRNFTHDSAMLLTRKEIIDMQLAMVKSIILIK